MHSANSETAPVIADAVCDTSPRRLTLKEASNGLAIDHRCALSSLRRRRILWSPSRLLVKQCFAVRDELTQSKVDDPTRTSLLVRSLKVEAVSIERPPSLYRTVGVMAHRLALRPMEGAPTVAHTLLAVTATLGGSLLSTAGELGPSRSISAIGRGLINMQAGGHVVFDPLVDNTRPRTLCCAQLLMCGSSCKTTFNNDL